MKVLPCFCVLWGCFSLVIIQITKDPPDMCEYIDLTAELSVLNTSLFTVLSPVTMFCMWQKYSNQMCTLKKSAFIYWS